MKTKVLMFLVVLIAFMFRGAGCSHCYDFLEYLNSIAKDYGYMFKLRSYEVYKNADNASLKEKVANFFDEKAPGVPYIIIGRSTFYGYSDKSADKVLEAIKSEYNTANSYDVFKEMEKSPNDNKDKTKFRIFVYLMLLFVGGGVILFIIRSAIKES